MRLVFYKRDHRVLSLFPPCGPTRALQRPAPAPRSPGPPVPRSRGRPLGPVWAPPVPLAPGPFAGSVSASAGAPSAPAPSPPALARRVGAPGDGRPEAPCEEEPGCPGAPRSPSGPVRAARPPGRPPGRAGCGRLSPSRARSASSRVPAAPLPLPRGSRVVACRPLRPDPAPVPDARRLGRAHDTCEAGAAGPSPSPCPRPRVPVPVDARREGDAAPGPARDRPAGGSRAGRPGRRERPRHGDPAADAPRNTSPGVGGGRPRHGRRGRKPPAGPARSARAGVEGTQPPHRK